MAKKKRKEGAKQLKAKRERRRRQRKGKSKGPMVIQQVSRDVPVAEKGFRIVGPAQAAMDYAKPLLDIMGKENAENFDLAMKVAQMCWNMAVCDDEKELREMKKMVLEDVPYPDAEAFIDMMIERHHHMFPYIKEESGFYIREKIIDAPEELKLFDESKIVLSSEIFPADRKDKALIRQLQKLDERVESGFDWEKHEKDFLSFQNKVVQRYGDWCVKNGVSWDDTDKLCFAVQRYLDFVYGYGNGTLFTIDEEAVREFVTLFWIRKTQAEPEELSAMPKALELFYLFLKEKGFVDEIDRFVQAIRSSRPEFLANLKAYFTPVEK
ncbi:MAG: hypothetical protein ACE5OR_03580 [bacterium]